MDLTTSSPAHSPMEVDSLDCITVSGSCSQSTSEASDGSSEDSIMQSIEDTGYQKSFESSCSPLNESTNVDLSLRGGIDRYRPITLTAEDSDDELDGKIDYEDLRRYKRFEEAEDDGESTSSDWDNYGDMPSTSEEYKQAMSRLEGSDDWNDDQKKLHRLIYMRGLHPMMPSWWKFGFRMWGVTQPNLFTPKNSKKRVAIHAYGNELAATKALESLFYLSQTATDYEEIGYEDKTSAALAKGIQNYVDWSLRDAGIDASKTLPNILVREFTKDFRGDSEDHSIETDFGRAATDAYNHGVTREEEERRFTRALSKDLEQRLCDLGRRWRALLWDKSASAYIAEPPTLYALAVIQHIVMIASHDSSTSTNPVVVIEQVRLNDRGLWLWNALTIALPVNLARDALCAMRDKGVRMAAPGQSGPDPDK